MIHRIASAARMFIWRIFPMRLGNWLYHHTDYVLTLTYDHDNRRAKRLWFQRQDHIRWRI